MFELDFSSQPRARRPVRFQSSSRSSLRFRFKTKSLGFALDTRNGAEGQGTVSAQHFTCTVYFLKGKLSPCRKGKIERKISLYVTPKNKSYDSFFKCTILKARRRYNM